MEEYKREFCCDECGLIWFDTVELANQAVCPECGNSNRNGFVYACDTFGFAYAYDSIVDMLKENGKKIHYAVDHPLYKGDKDV